MKIKYFGTAAAEGFPGLFCSCEACEKARKAGGKNIRTRSQALIDESLLIDFPADTYMHVINYGLELRNIKNLLITHSHDDHLYTSDFEYRKLGYAYFDVDLQELEPINIYSSEATGKGIKAQIEEGELEKYNAFVWHYAEPYKPFDVGGYTVTAMNANHDLKTEQRMYIIQKDGKTMLYGHDTGWFPDSTWDYLKEKKPYFNFVSLDCTCIIKEGRNNHMGIECCRDVREEFYRLGIADEKTLFCLHHFSHNGILIYDELKEVADKDGFLVSYDSAEFEF